MKKRFSIALAGMMMAVLAGCSSAAEETLPAAEETKMEAGTQTAAEEAVPETVIIRSYNGEKEQIELEVPYDPQRIAILDMASLDIIDALGLGDRVVGSAPTTIDYLSDYVPDDSNGIANLGTIKNADLVEVAACEPDVIFIGGRLSAVYEDLSAIAPVVYLSVEPEKGVVKSTAENARTIASIFGEEFDSRIQAVREQYEGKNAIVGMYSGSNYNVLGNDGRCSLIGNELGFHNLGADAGEITSTHGNEASWETIVNLNPEYMFVLDRNSAISSTEGNPAVQEAIENELIKELDVYIQALDVMLQDIEERLF